MKSLLPMSLAFFAFLTCLLAQREFLLPHNGSKRALLSASAKTQVDTLGGSHDSPAITSLKNGLVVIVWSGQVVGSTTDYEIYGQKYDLNGATNGGWFQVNTVINGYQLIPAIASLEDGGFVVIWATYDLGSSCPGVYAQRYNANGSLNGTNFIVECFATSMYPYPSVAGLFDGGFIIAWHFYEDSTYIIHDVFAKVYNADGSVRRPTFRVHTYANNYQSNPAVTSCLDGGFIIVWESANQDGDSYGVYGRKFKADGTPVDVEFQVNTFNQGAQRNPAISSLPDGKFVVAWDSPLDNDAGTVSVGIYGKIFNADTTLFKSEFRINSYVPGVQNFPWIAVLPNGNFVVAWYGDGPNGSPYEISAQLFSFDGIPSGTEFTVTIHTTYIYYPVITAIPNGYVIAWMSMNPVYGYSVYVRWFTCPTTTPMIYNNECHASCPTAAPNTYKNGCYLTCPNMVGNIYNQECYAACPSVAPYLYNSVCYTSPQIPPTNETLGDSFTTTVTKATEVSAQTTQAAALAVSAIKFTSAAAVWFNSLAEIVMYVRYMQISYPERLQYIINQPDPEVISFEFVSDLSEKLQEELTLYPIPERFQSSGFHSSFLVNFLPSILFLLGIIGFIIIACAVTRLTKSSKRIHWISMSVKQSMKWNYLLAYFTGYFPDIALTSSLEFRSNKFSSILDILSFATCIGVNLGVLIVILKIMSIVLALQNSKRQALQQKDNNPLKALQEKLKDYEIVFESFKDDSFFQQAYTIIFITKLYLFNVIIGYLFEYPVFQTLLLNIMGGATLVYLAIKRAFKQKIEFISILSQESILQIVHGCTLGLALIDSKKIGAADEAKETLGVIIIISNAIFSAVGAVFLVITVLTSLRDLHNWLKARKPVYNEDTHLTNTSFSLQNRSIQEQVTVTDTSVTNMLTHHENTSWNPVQVRRQPRIKRIRRQQIHQILSYIRNVSASNYGNNA